MQVASHYFSIHDRIQYFVDSGKGKISQLNVQVKSVLGIRNVEIDDHRTPTIYLRSEVPLKQLQSLLIFGDGRDVDKMPVQVIQVEFPNIIRIRHDLAVDNCAAGDS